MLTPVHPFLVLALSTEAKSRPYIVDLLSSLSPSEAPQTRSQTRASAKRKRNPLPVLEFKETPLSSLYVENADPEQIWAQLEIRAEGVCDMLQKALDGANTVLEEEDDDGNDSPNKKLRFSDLTAEDLEALGMDRETLEAFAKYADEQGVSEDSDTTDLEEEDDSDDADLGEEVVELKDSEDSGPSRRSALKKSSRSYRTELDDDFFDLASFNAETDEAEAKSVSQGRLGNDLENDDSESDADSVDYFAPADSIDDKNDLEESGSGISFSLFIELLLTALHLESILQRFL
jgi:U3 small nucleolar RNA-associated protein MPP10